MSERDFFQELERILKEHPELEEKLWVYIQSK